MKNGIACVVVMTLMMMTSAASQSWVPEFGVQGGFARLKPAGTHRNDALDLFALPGTPFLASGDPFGTFFGIIPLGGRFAIEPSVGASELSLRGGTESDVRLGVRLDAAFGPHFYGAVGGEVQYTSIAVSGGSVNTSPLGVLVAAGYRIALTRRLEGRIEAQVSARNGSKAFSIPVDLMPPPRDVYTVQVGISSRIGDRGATARSDALWAPAIGIQGGYYSAHFVGSETFTGMSLSGPGTSAGFSLSTAFISPQTASSFVLIPVGGRWAIEGGFSAWRYQVNGPSQFTLGTVTLSARADLAVTHGWYAGVGPVTNNYRATNHPILTQSGVSLAWGYRFHLAGDLGGRAEASYTMFARNHVLFGGALPANVLGLDLGMMMGL